jgi:hypothetical protein
MRRWLMITAVFVCLGAASNVITGWAFSILDRDHVFDAMWFGRLRGAYFEREHGENGDSTGDVWYSTGYHSFGCDVVVINEIRSPNRVLKVYEHRTGWPIRSLRGRECRVASRQASPPAPEFEYAIKLDVTIDLRYPSFPSANSKVNAVLPLSPMWPGFVVNAGVHAWILALMWWLMLTGRGVARRVRGRCAACGYPVGVSATCTECGRPVRVSVRRTGAA